MAKSLRSKIKRHFRTTRGGTVASAPAQLEAARQQQERLQAVLSQPPPTVAKADNGGSAGAAASSMEGLTTEEAAGVDLPELTTQNPAKLARKLRARRLAATRGVNPGIKKKGSALAGANQFHKSKKKNNRKNRR